MPKAVDVRPKRWSNILVLFDNGSYSAVWGNYDDSERRILGVRWNGNDVLENQTSKGFPTSRGKPVWHIEPDFLVLPLLKNMLTQVAIDYASGKLSEAHFVEYRNNIVHAIQEYALDI